jgi:carotenoid 1,2-hydratase
MTTLELPTAPGSYRWYYLDVASEEWSAVAIFMVGSVFSAGYSRQSHRPPTHFSAVNFALYRRGVRQAWALTEFDSAELGGDGRVLRIGSSVLTRLPDGSVVAHLIDRTQWLGRPLEARVVLRPSCPLGQPLRLVDGLDHWWHPLAIRAEASVSVPSHGVSFGGHGYHDGNHGLRPLGSDLPRWTWLRTHDALRSQVEYRPSVPGKSVPGLQVSASADRLDILPLPPRELEVRRSGWGLEIPTSLGLEAPVRLVESSPFYSRLEARTDEAHAMGEVAHFERFHSPAVRWMASFRTRRVEQAPPSVLGERPDVRHTKETNP